MATYSFKSVGKTQEQIKLETLNASSIPFGVKTPLKLGTSSDGILSMNYSLEEQFADNLRNLLLTNWGEHLGIYNFGANLKPITTELSSQINFDNEAITRIKNAVERWMPFIDLVDFTSTIDRQDNKNTAVIKIVISYNIPALQVKNKHMQIVLFAI